MNREIEQTGIWAVRKKLYKTQSSVCDIDCDTLNDHYCAVSNEPVVSSVPIKPHQINLSSKFNFQIIDTPNFKKLYNKLKNRSKKSPDFTGFCPQMLNLTIGCPNVFSALKKLVNFSFQKSEFPTQLKTSIITPVPKTKEAKDPVHFRPVAVQPFLSLLIEKCAHDQVMTYLNDNNILYPGQFGFRTGHSCETAIAALTEHIYKYIDKGNICILLALDLSKAFDVMVREFLLEKLRWYGFETEWFESYFAYRCQVVKGKNGKLSKVKFTVRGTPQGSIMGPICFSLYINDLPLVIQNCIAILYADDTQLLIGGPPNKLSQMIEKVKTDITSVLTWMDTNGMKLNIGKTQLIVLGNSHNVSKIGQISMDMNGVTILSQDSIKSLGITIDSKLSWYKHINELSRNYHFVAKSLYPLKPVLSQQNYLKVINACLISLVNYMVLIWGSASNQNLKIIEKCMRKNARNILNESRSVPIKNNIHSKLNWLLPNENYVYRSACFVFQLTHNSLPYFDQFFTKGCDIHEHNTRKKDLFQLHTPKSKYGERCLHFRAVNAWNKLPQSITQSDSPFTFKRKLKAYIISNI